MNFAREGLSFIVIAALVAAGAFGVALARRSWPLWLLAFALTVIALWVAYFFRDPQRRGERGERLVIAPADGKVVMITEVDEPTFMKSRAVRISIFMNVFNVHVNRYPVSGIVRLVERKPGRFLNAATEESSLAERADVDRHRDGIESHSRSTDRRPHRPPHHHRRQGGRSRAAGRAHGPHSLRLARRRVPAR